MPGLLAAKKSRKIGTQLGAIYALGITGDKRALAPLRPLLQDANETVHVTTAQAMAHIGKGGVNVLLALLASAKTENRRLAAIGLRESADRRVIGPLLHALKDPSKEVRYAVTQALFSRHDLRIMRPLLEGGVYYLPFASARAIEPLLDIAGHDPDNEAGVNATTAIERLGDSRLIPSIFNLLQGDSRPQNQAMLFSLLRHFSGANYDDNLDEWLAWWKARKQ